MFGDDCFSFGSKPPTGNGDPMGDNVFWKVTCSKSVNCADCWGSISGFESCALFSVDLENQNGWVIELHASGLGWCDHAAMPETKLGSVCDWSGHRAKLRPFYTLKMLYIELTVVKCQCDKCYISMKPTTNNLWGYHSVNGVMIDSYLAKSDDQNCM